MFPLYDTGTTGMQMCKIQGVMTDPDFHLRASAGSSQVTFKKQVEDPKYERWRQPGCLAKTGRPVGAAHPPVISI